MSKEGRYLPDRPRFRVLSDQQVHQLHLSALELLESTGVEVDEEQALSLLGGAGCFVRGTRARIPPRLVKQALSSVPERVAIRDRNKKTAMS